MPLCLFHDAAAAAAAAGVPGLVEDLIAILDSRGMVEGIYRVPGNKTGMHDLVTRYFDNPARKRVGIYQIENIHTCTATGIILVILDRPHVSLSPALPCPSPPRTHTQHTTPTRTHAPIPRVASRVFWGVGACCADWV